MLHNNLVLITIDFDIARRIFDIARHYFNDLCIDYPTTLVPFGEDSDICYCVYDLKSRNIHRSLAGSLSIIAPTTTTGMLYNCMINFNMHIIIIIRYNYVMQSRPTLSRYTVKSVHFYILLLLLLTLCWCANKEYILLASFISSLQYVARRIQAAGADR